LNYEIYNWQEKAEKKKKQKRKKIIQN